jgi:YQGE family putative transporter
MRVSATHIKNNLITFFGMDRLSDSFLQFAKSHLCFVIALNIHGVFVNILLMRASSDVNITIYYNMISYLASGFSMFLSAILSKRIYLKYVTFLGIGCDVIAYIIFLLFMDTIASFVVPIAILIGMGGGFFWFTYFNAVSLYSEDENREIAIGFIGVVSSFIALAVPAIAGAVIDMFQGFTGYSIMFGAAFLIAGISLYLFYRLPNVTPSRKKTKYLHCFKQILTNQCWFYVNAQVFLRSIRDGVFLFFLNVLLYEYIQSEAVIGFNALLVGFIAIFSQFIVGKYVTPKSRIKTMLIATTVLMVSVLILAVKLDAATVFSLSMINAFFVVLLMNPASAIDFLVISTMPDGYPCREEYFAIFEVVRAFGRVAGLVFLLFMPKTEWGYIISLVSITAVQYLTIFCASRAQKSALLYRQESTCDENNTRS